MQRRLGDMWKDDVTMSLIKREFILIEKQSSEVL